MSETRLTNHKCKRLCVFVKPGFSLQSEHSQWNPLISGNRQTYILFWLEQLRGVILRPWQRRNRFYLTPFRHSSSRYCDRYRKKVCERTLTASVLVSQPVHRLLPHQISFTPLVAYIIVHLCVYYTVLSPQFGVQSKALLTTLPNTLTHTT